MSGVGGVGGVVMDVEGLGGEMRGEGVAGIGQVGQGKAHEYISIDFECEKTGAWGAGRCGAR